MANMKVVLELDTDGYIRNIRQADQATDQFTRDAKKGIDNAANSTQRLTQDTNRLNAVMEKLRGLLVGGAFLAFATNAIMAADAISDLSDATEMSIGKILEIQTALQRAGGQASDAGKLITNFYKSIDEAASGSDKAQKAFGQVGVSLNDLAKLSAEDLFDRAARGILSVEDPAQRTALAIDLFGKSMVGVSPSNLAKELDALRGTFVEQEAGVKAAAEAVDKFERALLSLQMSFIKIFGPMIDAASKLLNVLSEYPKVVAAISIALLAIPGAALVRTFAGMASGIVSGTRAILGGLRATKSAADDAAQAVGKVAGKKMTQTEMKKQASDKAIAGGFIGLTGAAAGVALVGGGEEEKAAKVGDELKKNVGRTVEQGKEAKKLADELEKQRQAIENMADAYRNNVTLAESKLALEGAMLNMTEEQKSLYKGVFDINQRANEQIAKLEEKRKEAKGDNVALVDKEIKAVEALRQREIDAFLVLHERTQERKREEQAIKNIIAAMEEAQKFNEEMAQYAQQVDQARLAAWGQVDALQKSIKLAQDREALEKSIVNLHSRDQNNIKKLFDLEQQRAREIERIQNTRDLPFEDQQRYIEQINQQIDAEKSRVETTAQIQRQEQDSFVLGWQNATERWLNNLKTDAEYAAELLQGVTRGWEDAFVRFVQTGKLSFKDLANTIVQQMARMGAQQLMAGLFGDKKSGTSGLVGNIFGSLFGGFRASGGPVSTNKAYMVGERGPEMFVPNVAGSIVPNTQMAAAGNTQVVYNINATDASSFKQLLARDPEFLFAVTESARKKLPTRSRR